MATSTTDTTKSMYGLLYSDGVVTINKVKFRCNLFKTLHTINQLPMVQVQLTTDPKLKENPVELYKEIYDFLMSTPAGVNMKVEYTLTGQLRSDQKKLEKHRQVLFEGVLLSWSPVWVVNGLYLNVWGAHPLVNLMWTQSHVNELHGRGMTDWRFPTLHNEKAELVPFMRGEHSDTDVTEDLWKKVIKPDLLEICNLKRMDDTNSEECAKFLKNDNLDKSSTPLTFKVNSPFSTLVNVRNTIMSPGGPRDTLWDRLIDLSVRYKFTVIPRATDYMIAPVMPATGATTEFWYFFTDLATLQEYNMLVRDFVNTVSILNGCGDYTGFFDVVNKTHEAPYVNLSTQQGRLMTGYTGYGCNWLSSLVDPVLHTATTLGLQDERLFASGYVVSPPEGNDNTVNTRYNKDGNEDANDRYAQLKINEETFRGRTAVVRSMISFDSTVGSLMRMEIPNYNTPGKTSTLSMYGRVHSMCIILGGGNQSGSWYVLDNVRSDTENQGLPQYHPLYDKKWIRAPYLDIDGFTKKMEAE